MTAPAASHPVAQASVPRRHAQMARYAWWQMRDYAFERGLPTIIVGGIVGALGAMPIRAAMHQGLGAVPAQMIRTYGSAQAAQTAMLMDASMLFLRQFMGALVFLGALFPMNGLVSNDRKNGFYRFLFAKPVSPERYYGQAFVLHAAGFLGAIIVLGLLWGAFVVPVLSVQLLTAMLLVYLCYAGIAFLLTAAAKWDWLSLVAVSFAATLLWEKFGASGSPFALLLYLLPPLPRIDAVYAAATQHVALPWHILGWLAGYGLACYAAGLVVLRHRRLATP